MANRRRRSAAFLASALSLVGLSEAENARGADAETERARALFAEAGDLDRLGQWQAAQEKLRAALRLRETPQLYYALGWALENDDKLLEARNEYETAARKGRERPGGEEAARLATARLAVVNDTIPRIKVHFAGRGTASRPGVARVFVDGNPVSQQDDVAMALVNPGSHVVRIERTSDGNIEQVVYVGRGAQRTIEVYESTNATVNRGTPVPRGRAVAAPKRETEDVLPWLVFSGGIILAAGGSALLVSAAADAGTRDEMQSRWCSATACTGAVVTGRESPQAADFRRQAAEASAASETKQAFGLALGGAGLVAATVGAVLLIYGDGDRTEGRSPRAPAQSRFRPHANVGPIAGGAAASASFTF